MRIAVCFKVITDYDQVPANNWRGTGLRESKFVKKNFGFFCEGALETGLRVKDIDKNVYLEAISFSKEDRIFTEALYAAGYSKVTYILGDSSFDSENTAKVLSKYINDNDFDLVLTGEAVGPLETGTVPYLISKYSDLNLIDRVTEITIIDGKPVIFRETEEANYSYEIDADSKKKTLAIISNAKYAYLRFALFKDKERAKGIPANIVKGNQAKKLFGKPSFELPSNSGRNVKLINKEDFIEIFNEIGGDCHDD